MADQGIGIGMIGCGTVGGGVATLLRDEAALYAERLGRAVSLRRVLVRDPRKAAGTGVVDASIVTSDADAFFRTEGMDVVVEVAGGVEPIGGHVRRALESGRHVVTANKSLLAAQGPELFALARKHGVSIAFEASCAGGIPCITALQFGLMANRVGGLYGILNGTCNYILTRMTRDGVTYDAALADAQRKGYAEADPTLDVSGQDAAQKLAILASLAFGRRIAGDAVPAQGIDGLELHDLRFAAELGYDIRLLAIAEREPQQEAISVSVEPCFVHREDMLAQVVGPFNALSVYGHAVGHTMFYGPGAGRLPTASAVVSDVLNVASGWYPRAFEAMRLTPDRCDDAELIDPADTVSRYYVRIDALDVPGVMAKITTILGERGISLSAVMQHESAAGQFVPVVVLAHDARRGDLLEAVTQMAALEQVRGLPVVLRIVDTPKVSG